MKRPTIREWLLSPAIKRQVIATMSLAMLYSGAVTLLVAALRLPAWNIGAEAAATLGVFLGILVVFRNNTANDRWWEARKLWGQLVNDSRNLALKVKAYATVEPTELAQFAELIIAFAHALRVRLCDGQERQIVRNVTVPEGMHGPGYVAERIYQKLSAWGASGRLGDGMTMLCSMPMRGD